VGLQIRTRVGNLPDGRRGMGAGAVHDPAGCGDLTILADRVDRQDSVVGMLEPLWSGSVAFERVAVNNFTIKRDRLDCFLVRIKLMRREDQMSKAFSGFISLALILGLSQCARPAYGQELDEIRRILQGRKGIQSGDIGLAVGIVSEKGSQTVGYGKLSRGSDREIDGDTVFEIGSITKVFTSILLADMVGHGEVSLNDPIAKFLPKSVKAPTKDGKEITLLDLSTHISGLPRLPTNLAPKDPRNPYADYTVEQLYDCLSKYTLTREIGSKYEYSNLGVGLLGHLLAVKVGSNYEALVQTRICQPLQMLSTSITLSPSQQARLATGYDAAGQPAMNWDSPTLAAAGMLRSTAKDMARFLAANMGLMQAKLLTAMQTTHKVARETGQADLQIALGWHVWKKFGTEIVWHNGGTGGYHSFIGFVPTRRKGVVVLSNSANDIDDIGLHLLESRYELSRERTAIKVDPNTYSAYVGRYELAPNVFFTISREAERLMAQLTGQSKLEIFPETETKFFYKAVDAQLDFRKDDKGQVTHLVLHQNQVDQAAKKISNEVPEERKAIPLDPKIYDLYVGQYQLAPNFTLTITKENDRLMAQASGQPKFELFPESEIKFFFKIVDAQITFSKNDKGEITRLTLHQNGDHVAKRIK